MGDLITRTAITRGICIIATGTVSLIPVISTIIDVLATHDLARTTVPTCYRSVSWLCQYLKCRAEVKATARNDTTTITTALLGIWLDVWRCY